MIPSRLMLFFAALAFFTAIATAQTTLAAVTPLDAKGLALRQSDFPAGAKRMSEKLNRSAALPGGTGQAYTTTFQFTVGGRTHAVGTVVITAPTVAVARKVFASVVADGRGSAVGALRLSAMGDQQVAALYGRPSVNEASAAVWVRKATVVWQVQTSSVRNPFGYTKAEALGALTTYARKQQRRVDEGLRR